jgi:hypothetical protein
MRSGYKELGLKITDPLKDDPRRTRRPHMVEENKDEGARDPIKFLLEESLARQREKTMNNFAQILRRLPTIADTSTSSDHFGGTTPFKVQVNFDIAVF